MLVFPFIFGRPRWLYLLLFLAFLLAGFLFNRFLRHSLRNGPRWGKSSAQSVRSSRSSGSVSPRVPSAVVRPSAPGVLPSPVASVTPRPAPSPRPSSPAPASVSPVTPLPVPSARPASPWSPPVSSVTSRPAPSPRPASPRPPPVSRFAYCRRYPDLLALCAGDVLRADRLVDLESKSSGSAAPDVWVNLAISRLSLVR